MADSGLVEAYMMRKLHKEKMKKMEASNYELKSNEGNQNKSDDRCDRSGSGCFYLFSFKKVHPNSPSAHS